MLCCIQSKDRAKEIYLDHMEKLKSKSDSSSSCEPYCKRPKYSEDVEEVKHYCFNYYYQFHSIGY